jgi:hypothetical protein
MALTGNEDGAPLLAPACIASAADAALQTFAVIAGSPALGSLSGSLLLGERAAIAGHVRRGRTSPGGTCRLLRTATDWIALNLARDDDVALLSAWLQCTVGSRPTDYWPQVTHELENRRAAEIVARGRELGLPIARVGETAPGAPWTRIALRTAERGSEARNTPLVIDLSSLWAGPLAGHLLEQSGARVIKVESINRPDGARRGPQAFYDLLNTGKQSVALDFHSHEDLRVLDHLLRQADIVIEASRPRALAQLGLDAHAYMQAVPGMTWLSITGYGRDAALGERVAFGDDAAAAGGLVAYDCTGGSPMFCGDAIADPLTGLHGALAAFGSWRLGGGRLLDIAMSNVCAHVRGFAEMPDDAVCAISDDGYMVSTPQGDQAVEAPRPRRAAGRAATLGEHTRAVVGELC